MIRSGLRVSSIHPRNYKIKNILKRNIKPEGKGDIVATNKIEIYHFQSLTGILLIETSDQKGFVNFTGNEFHFGFRLTYGIGMSL